MGKSGASAFTRIMGLLLAALAIEFIISGSFDAVEEYWNSARSLSRSTH